MSYRIVSDATLDLPMELIEKHNVYVIPMTIILDGEEIEYEPSERNLTIKDFYNALREGKSSTTSQINPNLYIEHFTPILEAGEDIIYMGLTSGLSGTYQSANIAKGMLKDDYPDRKIMIVESFCASAGLGYCVNLACMKKEEGLSVEELFDWVTGIQRNIAHWFTVDDLFHLQKGGRLSIAEAMVGSALKIKPILSVDEEGKLYAAAKVRGNKKSEEFMINKIKEELSAENHTVFVAHGDCEDRAIALAERIKEETDATEVGITKIGPIIGTHTGPGMLAVLYEK
ncbi:MAG: DegV family protein [Lachnospiraceae bacterium]|nr:DegV family protein [Lachnospiraceae bacterium]